MPGQETPPPLRVVVVTWAPGGNLPPLLAAARLMTERGHRVTVLASRTCWATAEAEGHDVVGYRRAPEPDTRVAFEHQAEQMTATAAGLGIARDVRDVLEGARAELAIFDCMLPAAAAGCRAADVPAASLVHFLYGAARRHMLRRGGAWTTDLATLTATHRALEQPAPRDGLAAWEAPELVLVTAPRFIDVDVDLAPHVVHAGPLAVRRTSGTTPEDPPLVLLSFSTSVMDGQREAVERVCAGVADAGVRAVLTLGPALRAAGLRIPDQVEALPWADHDELLPRCTAAAGHGGLGTTLRALAHGVPLVLVPLGRDQLVNAARVAEIGAGIALAPDATVADVRAAIEAVLADRDYAIAAEAISRRIADENADARAVEALERCAAAPRRA
jgi:MGT family glycosyltransferase